MIRYLPHILGGVIGLMLLAAAFFKGQHVCELKHARAAAKDTTEWVEKTGEANEADSERGRDAAVADTKNEEMARDIEDKAAVAPDADDICLPDDVVDGLRALQ